MNQAERLQTERLLKIQNENLDTELASFSGATLALFLLSPFLVLVVYIGKLHISEVFLSEAAQVFALTSTQALASAIVIVVLGLIGSLGLLWFSQRYGIRRAVWLEAFVILPNAAPVLILLLMAVKFFPWARGLSGVVFVHTLINVGLASTVLVKLLNDRVGSLSELAWIEGASGFKFFRRGVLPLIQGDLAKLGLFFFALCFTSFSVPLLIGGSRATTIEVLIWQKIRVNGDWGEALALAILQMLAVIALSFLLKARTSAEKVGPRLTLAPILSWRWGLGLLMISPVLMIASLCDSFFSGLHHALELDVLWQEMPSLLYGSSAVALGSGFLVMALLLAIAYLNPTGALRRFLIGYAAPSAALTGFALLIVWRESGDATFAKIALGLALTTVPAFYRLRWDSVLQTLAGQRLVAVTMGASRQLVFRRVIFPQVIRPAAAIAGLTAMWAWGDFALSSVIAERTVTVGMQVQALIDSYRLDVATVLVWILILGGAVTYAFFIGVGRVLGSQSLS